MIRPAVFLDRDGTIIEDRGHLDDPRQVQFLEGVFEALRALGERFALVIVTNQSGIAKGCLTAEQVDEVNRAVVEGLSTQGVTVEQVCVCPHARADNCHCIKPKPHFPEQAAREHGLDLRRSYTIGDHPHDAELATAIGATGLYVLSGHGTKHRAELPEGFDVFDDLAHAARWILRG